MIWRFLVLPVGFALDMLLGDPKWLPHPVVLIGKLIQVLESILRRLFWVLIPDKDKAGSASKKQVSEAEATKDRENDVEEKSPATEELLGMRWQSDPPAEQEAVMADRVFDSSKAAPAKEAAQEGAAEAGMKKAKAASDPRQALFWDDEDDEPIEIGRIEIDDVLGEVKDSKKSGKKSSRWAGAFLVSPVEDEEGEEEPDLSMEEASKIPSLPGKGSFSLGRQPRSKAERNGRKNQSSAGSQSEEEENKPDPVRPKRKEKKPEDERFLESFHRRELAGGILEVILVCAVCLCLPFFLLRFLYQLNVWAGLALEVFWCYQLIATKSLSSESMRVYRFLKSGSLRHARKAVSMIVGRDTERLDEEGVIKATVETIAENAADGVVAPMFFMAIGGIPLMFLYKGINTMDSMLGYKNEKYLYYGRCAAKVDDAANFLPSRLTGLLMVLAALISGFDGKNAWKIFRRDRYKHASPNSAQSEAAMAGALGIQLAGNAYYFGELYEKPTIGDPLRNISKNDIPLANRLLFVTAFLALLVFTLLYVLIH